ATLYANTHPAWLRDYISTNRQMNGENQARMGAYLQAMTGNIGVAGGGYVSFDRSTAGAATTAPTSYPTITHGATSYTFPCLMNCRNIKDAILLMPQVNAGTLSLAQYLATIGQAQASTGNWTYGKPVANLGMLWGI